MPRQCLSIFPLVPIRFLFWIKRKDIPPCQLVYSSNKKKLFSFFYPHTLTFRLKRPVYRGFSGEGKCEGKCFTLTLLSHLPSHPYSSGKKASCLLRILWMGVRFNRQGAKKQLFIGSAAMVHCWCNYAAPLVPECFTLLALPRLLVFLCWTVGIAMLNLWYSYAEPLVPECYTLLVPFFYLIYSQYFRFDLSQFTSL